MLALPTTASFVTKLPSGVGEEDVVERRVVRAQVGELAAARGEEREKPRHGEVWLAGGDAVSAVANFGAKLGRAQYVFGARVALLNAPFEIDAQTAEASMQAGFLFRQFNDRQQAIDWLSLSS